MYTGIVQALLPIESCERQPGLMTFSILFPEPLLIDLTLGASVAVNGCCFTVTCIEAGRVSFDAIAETLDITNISELEVGSLVNIERSARSNAEIGGHILSGHIFDIATLLKIDRTENNCRVTFQGAQNWMRYVFNKGFLAVNGCSLTIAAVDHEKLAFSINLIPETLSRTNFSTLAVNDTVNIEIDQQTQVIVDTVTNIMESRHLTP